MDLYTNWNGRCPQCDGLDCDFIVNNVAMCPECEYKFLVDPKELEN